jgi:hypothetical protein
MAKAKSTTAKARAPRKAPAGQAAQAVPPAARISAWEEDPSNGTPIARPVPNLAKGPLAFGFAGPAYQPAAYATGTAQFRYWTAAEALRRCADFWMRVAPIKAWHNGKALAIRLDVGEKLNASYDRSGLNFYHAPGAGGHIMYSGESPDVVCHELGHAVLDALKPQLWDAASQEAAAFHEAMGDISAILAAIQLPSLRTAILGETGGRIYRTSRLSRMAEQLGAAIRVGHPDDVEPDCLRNAVNSFSYSAPMNLPPRAPANQLSAEPHSFSRLFTAAAFEILAALVTARAGGKAPTEAHLLAAGDDLGRILARGVLNAAVVSNFYAQVAAAMVQAAAAVDPAYPALVKTVFVRRAILSLHSAAVLHQFAPAADAARNLVDDDQPLAQLALPADHYGLDRPVLARAASQPRPFAAMAMVGNESVEPPSGSEAARAFVDDLFRRGRVDYNGHGRAEVALFDLHRSKSHRLTADPAGLRLERLLFDCGFCS